MIKVLIIGKPPSIGKSIIKELRKRNIPLSGIITSEIRNDTPNHNPNLKIDFLKSEFDNKHPFRKFF